MKIHSNYNRHLLLRPRYLILSGCILWAKTVLPSTLQFDGNPLPAIEIVPEKNTGIDAVYVLNGLDGVSLFFDSNKPNQVNWYAFNYNGAAFATKVDNILYDDKKSILNHPENNTGYIVEDGGEKYYFWIIDYNSVTLNIASISPSDEQDCNATILDINGEGSPIYFYTINGRREILSRDISIRYSTLKWDEESSNYRDETIDKILPSITDNIYLTPPALCATTFRISGDRFLKEWNREISYESDTFLPNAVEVKTTAIQDDDNVTDEASNVIKNNNDGLGGSAPVNITFQAFVTDGVVHNEWQMASDENFENVQYRFNEQNLDFTFTEEGTMYVRFIGSNSDGSCEAFGETYSVNIGSSELKIPNAFSPGNDGINDVWKVSYRSLIKFECTIFDRHGHEIFRFNNPADGWDGKKNGKYVKPGVYYYVIRAIGSDGKKYNKSGDINILNYKGRSNQPEYD